MDRLRREAECRGQTRVLGFFLDLTAKLSGETTFESEATKLHVRVPTKPTQFFNPPPGVSESWQKCVRPKWRASGGSE